MLTVLVNGDLFLDMPAGSGSELPPGTNREQRCLASSLDLCDFRKDLLSAVLINYDPGGKAHTVDRPFSRVVYLDDKMMYVQPIGSHLQCEFLGRRDCNYWNRSHPSLWRISQLLLAILKPCRTNGAPV